MDASSDVRSGQIRARSRSGSHVLPWSLWPIGRLPTRSLPRYTVHGAHPDSLTRPQSIRHPWRMGRPIEDVIALS